MISPGCCCLIRLCWMLQISPNAHQLSRTRAGQIRGPVTVITCLLIVCNWQIHRLLKQNNNAVPHRLHRHRVNYVVQRWKKKWINTDMTSLQKDYTFFFSVCIDLHPTWQNIIAVQHTEREHIDKAGTCFHCDNTGCCMFLTPLKGHYVHRALRVGTISTSDKRAMQGGGGFFRSSHCKSRRWVLCFS